MHNTCEHPELPCSDAYNCCDCGSHDCGCRYCWSCNACDACKVED